ncbi:hypothetical protein ABK040_004963 [Willaertia magna]
MKFKEIDQTTNKIKENGQEFSCRLIGFPSAKGDRTNIKLYLTVIKADPNDSISLSSYIILKSKKDIFHSNTYQLVHCKTKDYYYKFEKVMFKDNNSNNNNNNNNSSSNSNSNGSDLNNNNSKSEKDTRATLHYLKREAFERYKKENTSSKKNLPMQIVIVFNINEEIIKAFIGEEEYVSTANKGPQQQDSDGPCNVRFNKESGELEFIYNNSSSASITFATTNHERLPLSLLNDKDDIYGDSDTEDEGEEQNYHINNSMNHNNKKRSFKNKKTTRKKNKQQPLEEENGNLKHENKKLKESVEMFCELLKQKEFEIENLKKQIKELQSTNENLQEQMNNNQNNNYEFTINEDALINYNNEGGGDNDNDQLLTVVYNDNDAITELDDLNQEEQYTILQAISNEEIKNVAVIDNSDTSINFTTYFECNSQ